MTGLWRILFRENPMQIETLRAIRRFTVTGGKTAAMQRNVARTLVGLFVAVYGWFLLTIIAYREDISQGIFWFEFILLTLLVPGSLYAAISGERERLTWDSLILTNLSPARILTGKLLWRLGMAGAILLLFVPPLLLTHFITKYPAAYSLGNMLWIQTCMTVWCVFLAAFTLWVSSKTKRSVVTLSVVTVSLLAGLALVPALMMVFGNFESSSSGNVFTLNYNDSRAYDYRLEELMARYTPKDLEMLEKSGQLQALYRELGIYHSPMAYLGSLVVHLNPGYLIGAMDADAFRHVERDYWRDFLGSGYLNLKGLGIFTLLPAIYLGFAAFCLNRTLKTLARLGLPSGATR